MLSGVLLKGSNAQETNTFCDTGPDAITDVFRYDVPQACFEFAGVERCFYTLVPPCAVGKNVPLVLDNHGFGSCPLWSTFYTGWREKAFDECFVLVWPLGQTDPDISDGPCFAAPGGLEFEDLTSIPCCCEKAAQPFFEPDPVAPDFLRASIEGVVDYFNNGEGQDILSIDTTRIYMAGHSNGCMASLATATLHSDIVAAVCCHAGSMVSPFAEDYNPVPVWMVHGRLDAVLPYDGLDIGAFFGFPGFGFASNPEIAKVIADKNGCSAEILETDVKDGDTVVGTSYKYSNCTDGADVELVALEQGGHTPYKDIEEDDPGAVTTTIDTTGMAWDFCSSHAKAFPPPTFSSTPSPTFSSSTPSPTFSSTPSPTSPSGQPDSSSAGNHVPFVSATIRNLLPTVSLWVLLLLGN